jgi:hypothetical protein
MNTFKKLGLLVIVAVGMVSCGSSKLVMGDKEIQAKGYSLDGWHIRKQGEVVGTLVATEWGLYRKKMVREITISTSFSSDAEMQDIARFLHSRFPNDMIEVNEEGGNSYPLRNNQDVARQ